MHIFNPGTQAESDGPLLESHDETLSLKKGAERGKEKNYTRTKHIYNIYYTFFIVLIPKQHHNHISNFTLN